MFASFNKLAAVIVKETSNIILQGVTNGTRPNIPPRYSPYSI